MPRIQNPAPTTAPRGSAAHPPAPPVPRIADMSQLEHALTQVAVEAARAPLAQRQHDGLVRVLSDGVRLLDHNSGSATMMASRGRFDSAAGVAPATVLDSLSVARGAVSQAHDAALAVQPQRTGIMRRPAWQMPADVVSAIGTAATHVAAAEHVAARASGPRRHQLVDDMPADMTIPSKALDEAMAMPGLRRAIERQSTPLRPPIQAVGKIVGRIAEGPVEVVGLDRIPRQGPFILAPTHASMADGPVWLPFLAGHVESMVRPMMKAGAGVLGAANERVLATGGIFPVQPGTGTGDAALAAAKAMLGKGQTVVIYPEGRMVDNDLVGQVRDGIARLALDAQVPVIPVAVYGTKDARIHGSDRRGVTMMVGQPIITEGAAASAHNVGVIRDRVQTDLVGLYGAAHERWQA